MGGLLAIALLASPASARGAWNGATLEGGGFAAGGLADRGAQADVTLELVNVEVDKTVMLFGDQWVIGDTSASLDTVDYYHEHTWSIPSTIPPVGAAATLNVTATDKSGRLYDEIHSKVRLELTIRPEP